MSVRTYLLNKFTNWALSKNSQDEGYAGEDDPRWAYTIRGDDGSPYLTRVLLSRWLPIKKLLGVGIYLHHFHRPDGDQEMHDHPWAWGASLVLAGSYVEERVDQIVETYDTDFATYRRPVRKVLTDTKVVRLWNFLTKDDFHAVRSLRGDTWTLFATGKRVQDWGFLVDGVKVPWREYLLLNPAKGNALDKIGKLWNVERAATIKIDFKTTDYCATCGDSPDSGSHLPHGHDYVAPMGTWDWVEPDTAYRERIRAAIRKAST